MAAPIAGLLVNVGLLGLSGLVRGSRLAVSAVSALVGAMGRLLSVVGTLTAGVGVLAAAFSAFILVNARAIDSIGKISTVIGISTDLIQKFGFAAEQTGVSFDQSSIALRRFSRRLGEAQRGTGELLPALRRLGINTKNADGSFKSAEQVLFEFADGLKATRGESARLSLAFKAFDSEGAELVATLEEGADALQDMFDQADKLGFVLDRGTIKQVEKFNDSFNVLVNIVKGAVRQFIGALAPAMDQLNADLAELVMSVTGGEMSFKGLGEYLKNTFFNILIDLTRFFEGIAIGAATAFNTVANLINRLGFLEDNDVKRLEDLISLINRGRDSAGAGSRGGFGVSPRAINETVELAKALKELSIPLGELERFADIGFLENIGLQAGLGLAEFEKGRDALLDIANAYVELNAIGDIDLIDVDSIKLFEDFIAKLEEYRDLQGDTTEFVKEFKVATTETNRELDLTLTRLQRLKLDFIDIFTKVLPQTFENIKQFIENLADSLREAGFGDFMKTLEDGFKKAGLMLEDALADAIMTGKADFTKLGEHIKKVLAKAIVQKFITGPILSIFGLAEGGPAKAGQPYIVGEKGPELFVPNQSGTVVPNHQLDGARGAGASQVTYNINAVDTQSFQQALARDPEFLFAVTQQGAKSLPRS
jgi:hypothetical protein